MSKILPAKVLLLSAAAFWLVLVFLALMHFWKFDGTAGLSRQAPLHWQDAGRQSASQQHLAPVALDPARSTLVMLVHPQCPCSRASLSELNHLTALCPNRASIFVLFLRPAGYSQNWVKTDLWRTAAAIPGVSVRCDDDGELARHFGAATSGDAVLYASDGRLLYQGGLTGERGHEGDNAGLSAVAGLLENEPSSRQVQQEPVYGCPLNADRRPIAVSTQIAVNKQGGLAWLP